MWALNKAIALCMRKPHEGSFRPVLVGFAKRAADAQTNGASLTGLAATADVHEDIEVGQVTGELERVPNDQLGALALEVDIDVALVDDDVAVSGAEEDARHGGLTPAGAVVLGDVGHRRISQT